MIGCEQGDAKTLASQFRAQARFQSRDLCRTEVPNINVFDFNSIARHLPQTAKPADSLKPLLPYPLVQTIAEFIGYFSVSILATF